MTKPSPTYKKTDEQARAWFMLISSGEATDADIADFENWQQADEAHTQAYGRISLMWNQFDVVEASEAGARVRASVEQPTFWQKLKELFVIRSPVLTFAVAASLLITVTGGYLFYNGRAPEVSPYTTAIAEVREITLADGSLITLGARSSIEVRRSAEARDIILKAGQAFFEVAPDTDKPFHVQAGAADVHVLGTRFDVHMRPEDVTIAVLDGRVRVSSAQAENDAEAKVLTSGQAILATATGLGETQVGTGVKAGGWRTGRLVYKGTILKNVIADANRYHTKEIIITDPVLANTQITTSFDVQQVSEFLETLPLMFSLKLVDKADVDQILIEPVVAGAG